MSAKVSGLIWEVGPLDRMQRFVLLAFGDMADVDGYCWPSVATVARMTLFSERYVMQAIQQLEDDEWLRVERRARNGRGSEYYVNLDKLEDLFEGKRAHEKSSREKRRPREASSHEKTSPHGRGSGEQSSREASSREIGRTCHVKTGAGSSEIHDRPIEEPSRTVIEPLGEGHVARPAPQNTHRGVGSDGEFALATEILRECKLSTGPSEIRALAEQINYEAPERGGTLDAAEFIRKQAKAAIERGEKVTIFWFKDRKFITTDVYSTFSMGDVA